MTLAVESEQRPLPRTVDVSDYRIVQEALINTVKHAGATTAARCCSSRLSTTATATARALGTGWGHGLIGMRERVSLHGGQLRVGPRPEGGFV